jgi:voltage-gated potassium channel Kch
LAQAVYQARAKIVVFVSVILIAITIAGSLMYEIENPESHRAAVKRLEQYNAVAIKQGYSLDPANETFGQLAEELNMTPETLQRELDGLAIALELPVEELGTHELVASEFSSIPQSMYWATVTMTTVGYGDIVPHTPVGKIVSAVLILLGYSLIIVPTGFVSAEIMSIKTSVSNIACRYCMTTGHDPKARFCKDCGEAMPER